MNDILLATQSKNNNVQGYFLNLLNSVNFAQEQLSLNIISSAIFCRALTASALLSGNLKNKSDVFSLTWNCSGPAKKIVAEANFEGMLRGFIEESELSYIEGSLVDGNIKAEPYIGFGEILISRTTADTRPAYNEKVIIETGEIAQDISIYLGQYLKVQSALKIGLSINDKNKIESCGGILLIASQKTSEYELNDIYQTFNSLTSLTEILNKDISQVYKIFEHLKLDISNAKEIFYKCSCDLQKIKTLLLSLPNEKLNEYKISNDKIEAQCQYCSKKYTFNSDEIIKKI
jgi:molecular chaperone Hsp33